MKPSLYPDRFAPIPPIAPGERLADIIAVLTSRMSEAQRRAFLAKMMDLDRERVGLSPLSVTLGAA